MKKKKIGFCKEATYIYRKNVGSVTKNKSNPYYTFESLTKYNEDLIENYKDEKGRIPKYIQAIILNNLRWRIKTDEIFPYHYEENEFNNAISRIKNILSYIENGTILNMPNMPIYHKFYIFNLKELNMKPYYGDNSFAIMSGNEVIFSSETIEISFIRLKIKDSKKIYILGCVKSPICEFTKPKVFLKYKLDDNDIIIKEMKLEEAGLSHYQSTIKTNTFYKFECELNIEDIQKFEFYSTIGNTKMTSEYRFGGRVVFNDSLERYKFLTKNKKYILEYNREINAFTVNKTTKEKIKQINENGIPYVLVSARMPKGMTAIRAELEAKSPMICYSGALVVDEEDHPIYSVAMPQEVAMKLCRRVYELNPKISVNIYTNDEWLVKDKKEYWAAQESDITGVIPQEVSFEDEEVYKEVHKVLCMGDKEDIAALEQQLVKEFPQIRIYRSKDTYLEIMSMKASKSDAIHMLKDHFHVKQEEIMAFGDNFNDIDMIRYAGLGVAMGNAADEVKEAADIVTDINDNEGERQILDKYFR